MREVEIEGAVAYLNPCLLKLQQIVPITSDVKHFMMRVRIGVCYTLYK